MTATEIVGEEPPRKLAMEMRAEQLGLTGADVDALVERFYERIRDDVRLGPIFAGEIGDHWPAHLDRMKAFWRAMAVEPGAYSGRPVPAHMKLAPRVTHGDFDRWLALFGETMAELDLDPSARGYFMARAEKMAKSLKLAMFGLKGA